MKADSEQADIKILLVEDNPGDIRLTREALGEAGVKHSLEVMKNGEAALNYLFRHKGYEQSARPDIIILDLNLPCKDGREVLKAIKRNRELKCIPVIVLTTSSDKNDILQCYDLHANCYVLKPIDIEKFIEVFRSINHFWFTHVSFPGHLA
jgi:two-component system response regulator